MSSPQYSLDLLRAHHEFPGRVMIKVIATHREDFTAMVVDTIRTAVPRNNDAIPHTTRLTPQARHQAVTLDPHFESAEEVLLVYERLRKLDGVVMLL